MSQSILGRAIRETRAAFGFLFRPHYELERTSLWRAPIDFIALTLAAFVLMITGGLIASILPALTGQAPLDHALESLDWPLWLFLLMGAVFAPLVEETAFRGALRPGAVTLGLATWVWLMMLLGFLMTGDFAAALPASPEWQVAIMLTICTLAGAFVFALMLQPGARATVEVFVARWFAPIFWFSILLFGFAHLSNFTTFSWQENGTIAPLLVLPQLIAGVMLGYARMRFGLFSAILSHGLINGTLISIGMLLAG